MERDKFIDGLKKIAGHNDFPIRTTETSDGVVKTCTYDKEWKSGGTEPVVNDEGEITGYKENYQDNKLPADVCKKLDEFIKENLPK